MVTGRANFDLINQQIYQIQGQQEDTVRRLEDLHRQFDALRLEMSTTYRELAKIRLDDLQAGEVISQLNESDQAVFMLIQNLKRTRLNLKEQIEASHSRRRQLDEQRKAVARQRDEAGVAMQHQLAQTHKRISDTDAYRQQLAKTQQAAAVTQNAEEKATQAEKDRQEKGKPYEADRLFMYLWERRFLTPEYQGGWFSRQLDNWVARMIDYQRNRSNYYMLLELPRRLREHAIKVKQTAALEAQALQTLERQAAEADGVMALQARVQEAQKQLKQLEGDITAAEADHQKLLAEEAAINTGQDPLSKQIIEVQAAALAKEPLAGLYRQARATARPDDDVTVARIQHLLQRQDQINEEIQSLNATLQREQQQLGELEEVRRRYRQNGYDSYRSQFPGDFSLGVLLGEMLRGMGNPDTVWGEIDRNHHSREPVGGGDFGGFGGSGGDLGGGGDFYTTDSF